MNPFHVLNVPYSCTDKDVRDAYHRLLRKYPPERNPEQFQMIQEAAQSLADERSRARAMVFANSCGGASPIEALIRFTQMPERACPPGAHALQNFLRNCTPTAEFSEKS